MYEFEIKKLEGQIEYELLCFGYFDKNGEFADKTSAYLKVSKSIPYYEILCVKHLTDSIITVKDINDLISECENKRKEKFSK